MFPYDIVNNLADTYFQDKQLLSSKRIATIPDLTVVIYKNSYISQKNKNPGNLMKIM